MVGTLKSVTEATDGSPPSGEVFMVGERPHGREGILEGVLERCGVKMPE
jgi:hypothetical protein